MKVILKKRNLPKYNKRGRCFLNVFTTSSIKRKMEQEKLQKGLLKVKELFDRFDIKFWLSGGIALGIIRDGSFLKNEHDIDLGIYYEDVNELIEKLEKNDCQIDVRKKDKHIRCIKINIDSVDIDIFTLCLFESLKENIRYSITRCEGFGYTYHIYPKEIFENLKEIQFLGQNFYIPNPIEKYFECEYGKHWKTPRDDWNCCTNPPCIRKKL